jgi:hypothetical protein
VAEGEDADNGSGRAVKRRTHGECVSILEHLTILRDIQERHELELRDADAQFRAERDRRYAEVNVEREKALKIKETADLAALQLAREIQTYKDEKANELREQINSERGLYASKADVANVAEKMEAMVQPLQTWITGQQGRYTGLGDGWKYISGAIVVAGVIIGIFFKLSGH